MAGKKLFTYNVSQGRATVPIVNPTAAGIRFALIGFVVIVVYCGTMFTIVPNVGEFRLYVVPVILIFAIVLRTVPPGAYFTV